MNKIILISALLFQGCLFLDSSSLCEGSACEEEPLGVSGKFLSHKEECNSFYETDACAAEDCQVGYTECTHIIRIALTNEGLEKATITEPTFFDLYSEPNIVLETISIDQIDYVMNNDTTQEPALSNERLAGGTEADSNEAPTFRRVLDLDAGESVGLTLSFQKYTYEPTDAKAHINFEISDQEELEIVSDTIKFSLVPDVLHNAHTDTQTPEKE